MNQKRFFNEKFRSICLFENFFIQNMLYLEMVNFELKDFTSYLKESIDLAK